MTNDNISTCAIYSNGTKIPDSFQLSRISIHTEVNHIGKATLRLYSGESEVSPFVMSDADTFKQGTDIRIGIQREEKEEILFEGFVLSTEIQVSREQGHILTVECRHYAYLTTLGRKNAIFENSKDSDIIKRIFANYSDITLKAANTQIKHIALTQYYCTDWDFVLSRADANGLIVITSGKEVVVEEPNITDKPVLEVSHDTDFFDFNATLSLSDQYAEVNTVAWNHTEQKVIQEKAKPAESNKQGDLSPQMLSALNKNKLTYQTNASVEKESLKTWADALALKASLSRYKGHFTISGNAEVKPGKLITINGLGKRFDGDVFIGSVEHILDEHHWTTSVGIGLSRYQITEQPDVIAPMASGFLPGIQGLHIGKVKQLIKDPTQEFRLLIEIPLLNGEKNEIWARFASPYAGKERGILFVPEIEDEVLIGFLNNDPCYPVVLGSLYSSKNLPPVELTEKNDLKTIVTREKLTIEMNDKDKIITVHTPAGNKIEINDKDKFIQIADQNKNCLLMDSNGIKMQSEKDIILKAKGNIQVDAVSKIDIKSSSSDIAMDGTNVKANAKVNLTLKGNMAELSGSLKTTVKGGMVMIN
ncbi:Rhs element Vgr protein [Parabacteroides sp. PFB2-12]|uniref:type VI secretion system tip protein VgrG n=1 Tax=unclassified Parabacteroides TaxID=2649774 RepID=UPI00247477D8|nr:MULTISPECIES: type VI secretion system tip protein VgrG [unclassified Parabacteroides]MDH6343906.1 Rhs element Vgr protein [Parabacteroides sp. PM6-13]MDH6391268.1 Rhs element Vgr protein [Parabacteroides sp. PFB2-12]